MPRGVPKSGFRRTKKRMARAKALGVSPVQIHQQQVFEEPVKQETDQEIDTKLKDRFSILKTLVKAATVGEARAVIVSGPAGLSKSYTVEKALEDWDPNETRYTIIKGYVRATGLFQQLWKSKDAGQVLVFDDADTIFFDDTSLNFLKAVCDTTEKRRVSYLAETTFFDESGPIPNTFQFDGTIIFITNYDFDKMIEKGHKLAPHMQALMSRSHYIDLAMKSRRDCIIRIRQVVDEGLFNGLNLSKVQIGDVMSFIEENVERVRELSLRTALKVGAIRKMHEKDWRRIATVTVLRNN